MNGSAIYGPQIYESSSWCLPHFACVLSLILRSIAETESERNKTAASNTIPLEFETLSLVNGGLIPQNPDETGVDTNTTAGEIVESVSGQVPPPAQIYCGLVSSYTSQ